MTPAEAAKLLTVCAAYDNRKPDADQAQAWSLALAGLRFIDCRDAVVDHYQRTREWIMPFDVIKGVKKVRGARMMEHFSYFQPPDGLSGPEYDRWYRDTATAICDGELTKGDAPAVALAGRPVLAELESRGLRTNAIPTDVITSKADIARQAAIAARAEKQANEKPEPEPLLRDDELSREPTCQHANPGTTPCGRPAPHLSADRRRPLCEAHVELEESKA